ncbi:MAG: 30S ribosomal protein S9 [Algisphaera sp.]
MEDTATPVLDLESNTSVTDSLGTDTLAAAAEPEAWVRPLREAAKPDQGGFVWGTGRRKSAVARVRMRPAAKEGQGTFIVSGPKAKNRTVEEFFSEPQHQKACMAPLVSTDTLGKVDVIVTTRGGGITGQAEAILLGVARALVGYDPTLEQALRDENFMTRDPREVERKKYGQRGARRRFQFSKR